MHFSAWADRGQGGRDRRQQPGAQHAVPGRLPDPVARRAEPVHGVEPTRRRRPARHLGRAARQHRCPLRRTREPRPADQLAGGRLLSRRLSGATASSSSAAGRPRRAAASATSTSPASTPRTAGASPTTSPARPTGPNSALDEQGPAYVEADETALLYFSTRLRDRSRRHLRQRAARRRRLRPRLGRRRAQQRRQRHPAERAQGRARDRLLVQPPRAHSAAKTSGRRRAASTDEPWSAPVNLGAAVNTGAAESRPSLSWDGQTLLFGRAPGPEGMSDIYTTTRSKLKGPSGG